MFRLTNSRQIRQVLFPAIATVGQDAGGSLSAPSLDHLHHWFELLLSLAAGVTLCPTINCNLGSAAACALYPCTNRCP
jgi:hypothetical protein